MATITAPTSVGRHSRPVSPAPATMAGLADFRRLATVGSRWRLEGHGRYLRSGFCVVTSVVDASPRALPRYRVVFDDGATATNVRWDLPPVEYLAFDGPTITTGTQ